MHNNVANCLTAGVTKMGYNMILITPEANEAARDEELLAAAKATGRLEITTDPRAVRQADFVYTDTWVDMENFNNPAYAEEKERRLRVMMPYQVNAELLGGSRPYIMHDMPVHPGLEIAEELIESERSIIYDQAENRLHAEKALMLHLLGSVTPAPAGRSRGLLTGSSEERVRHRLHCSRGRRAENPDTAASFSDILRLSRAPAGP